MHSSAPTSRPATRRASVVLAGLVACCLLPFLPAAAAENVSLERAAVLSPDVVISQVYGGGGNAGATYTNDFVELFNRGSSPVDISAWSVQYASATGSSWNRTNLSGTLQPGQYYLVQQAAGAGGTVPLPTPDATGTAAMSATAGKVALVTNQITLICGVLPNDCLLNPAIRDLVGYGTTANNFEGTGPTPATSNTTAALRGDGGCTETDNNATDFTTGAPTPRNTATTFAPCGADTAPAVSSSSPANSASGVPVDANISITFSEPVSVSGAWYTISCGTSGAHTAVVSGGPTTYTLDPDVNFSEGETCTVTIEADLVLDQDGTAQPMAADHTFSFMTATPAIEINQVQAATHRSPFEGTSVTLTPAIVTALRSNGFFLQDPTPDSNAATSEAIFVFTSSTPTVAVGDAVTVSGSVVEFRAGGASSANLTLTEITGPSVTVLSSGNTLPAATVIGTGGRVPPTMVIDDDAGGSVETGGSFDAASDGIDFYESLEAMRVQVNDAVVTGPKNNFGEVWVLPDNGAGAALRTARGGIVIRPGDFNPERVQLDDAIAATPEADVGDTIPGATVGVLNYDFGNFEVLVTSAVTAVSGGLTREVTAAAGPHELSVATFNVENLDPLDPASKFADLAGLIVNNLRSPDVIGLEEVQDNNGAANDSTTDASLTLSTLAAAIVAAGGPMYEFRQIDPVDDQDGGEPGGNIRVAFLFRTDRGVQFVDRPGGGSTTSTGVVSGPSGPELTASPGRVSPTDPAWNSSRKPLAGEFLFRGEKYFVVVNHFNSKGGDQPLFGRFQPPTLTSEVQRLQQAQVLNDFVDQILAVDANANIIALGDFNDFEFSPPLQTLMADVLNDLIETLPPNERYGYVFDGNSQTLDHILVSDNVMAKLSRVYDVVHVNAEFADQTSDHDPSVVRIGDEAELSLTKVAGPPTVTRGGIVTHTLRVTNGGPNNASPVILTDPLPAGAELVNIHHEPGDVCGGTTTVTCDLGTLAPDTTATVVIEVRMTEVGMRTNTATVDAPQGEQNTQDNQASATVNVIPQTFSLTVTKAGTGAGTVTSSPAGIDCGTDCSETYDEGTVVTLTAAPASGSTFTGWSGACTGTGTCMVTMSQARNVTATFTRITHALTVTRAGTGTGTVTSSPAGINCGTDCSESYNEGTVVTLTATPASGSTFTGWSGACTGTGTCTVTMSQARAVTATFTLITHTLTVAKSGDGTGTVTSSPAGIDCGTDCSESYTQGTNVTLSAVPAFGSAFTGWSGDCTGAGQCTVTMSQARNVTANFVRITHTLTVTKAGAGQGTVTSSPAGIDCGTDCSETYDYATLVTLTATPAGGSTFAGWSGACSGTGTCTVTMNEARSVTATFRLRACRIGATPRTIVAGRRTTLRVSAVLLGPREGQGGVLVRVRGGGVSKSARTNDAGSVRIAVRPSRAGQLRVTAPELGSCSASVRVRPRPRGGTAGAGTGAGPALTGRPG